MGSGGRFELVQLRTGAWAVRDAVVGEVMHPGAGPGVEAWTLYVEELQLGRLWSLVESGQQAEAVVWDVGLGAGANALAVLRSASTRRVRLRMWSFDVTLEGLAFARRYGDRLGYVEGMEAVLDRFLSGGGFVGWVGEAEVEWRFVEGDFSRWLVGDAAEVSAPDAVAYDPFSPARNPALWTVEVFRRLYRRLDPGRACVLATYSRSSRVRVALLVAGFYVGRGRAVGVKEETTVASNCPDRLERPLDGAWLARLRRSTAAEPAWLAGDPPGALRPSTWDLLMRHPQFAGCGMGNEPAPDPRGGD